MREKPPRSPEHHTTSFAGVVGASGSSRAIKQVRAALKVGKTPEELRAEREGLRRLISLSERGRKFVAGRKPNTGGPIRKAIARLLKRQRMSNSTLWDALASRPPRGWTFLDNRQGKYCEGPKAGEGMNYARFCNVASEERGKLKG